MEIGSNAYFVSDSVKMGKTLYVTDLDGTLMRDDKSVSEKTVTILNRLIDRGLPITYATARSLGSASAITKAIHFSLPVILRNGTNIADPQTGEEIKRASFKAEKIQEIRQCIGEAKIPGYVTAYIRGEEKTLYLANLMNEGFQAYLEDHMNDKRLQAVQTEKELYEGDVCYFTFIAKREELDPLYERVKDSKEWNCVYQKDTYRSEFWLEICPKDATKAKAVQKIQKKCGCERVVVFGDSLNDISMFQIADEAYAVANAVESLKAAATGVIGDNNSDGVAEWLWQNERAYYP